MGEVRRATQISSGGRIAVKILRPELVDDPQLIARFLQERDVLCSLDHPNLVRVHDLVVEGGSAAIVMDLVEGSDLRRELAKSGTLAPSTAVRFTSQLLTALAAVHEIDVVHRDVKPENILLGHDGQVRLTDFGIARLTHGPSLTRLTGLIGTPEYLAPELAEREHATPAADVYAAGIVLYELLTGFTPFAGGHPAAVLRRHMEELPAKPAGLPDPLWHLLYTMLEKNPNRRPSASSAAMQLAGIEPALRQLEPLPPSQPIRESEESVTSLRIRHGDKTERATVLRGAKHEAPKNGGWRSQRRLTAMAITIAVIAAGVTVGLIVIQTGPPLPASYTFAPESFPSGLIVFRTWTLHDGSRPKLRERVRVADGRSSSIQAKYDDVVPEAVARSVTALAFVPTPDQILERDPVVQYDFNLAPGHSSTISYSATIPAFTGPPSSDLKSLAHDQIEAQDQYLSSTGQAAPITLESLSVSPTSASLSMNGELGLVITGTMSNGSPATSLDLAGVSWSSGDSAIAGVANGIVTGFSVGSVTITAQAGRASATAQVTVTASSGGQASNSQTKDSAANGSVSGSGSPGNGGGSSGASSGAGSSAPGTSGSGATGFGTGSNGSGSGSAGSGSNNTTTTTTTQPRTTTTTSTTTTTTTTTTTAPAPAPAPQTYGETVGGVTNTWTNYSNAGGTEGPQIAKGTTVQIACKVTGFKVADGNTWWYRIASSPWNGTYYASADAFYNNGATSGSLSGTPFVDNNVPNC
jgi:hypothetical protein